MTQEQGDEVLDITPSRRCIRLFSFMLLVFSASALGGFDLLDDNVSATFPVLKPWICISLFGACLLSVFIWFSEEHLYMGATDALRRRLGDLEEDAEAQNTMGWWNYSLRMSFLNPGTVAGAILVALGIWGNEGSLRPLLWTGLTLIFAPITASFWSFYRYYRLKG